MHFFKIFVATLATTANIAIAAPVSGVAELEARNPEPQDRDGKIYSNKIKREPQDRDGKIYSNKIKREPTRSTRDWTMDLY
ncbi:uncharacterized protein N7483_003853 [Penicillium malachiteum]|uniref:uncharacterized protein n=1 Tax=Penicillium malachiteum TaxID=1324776 RepID=UPI002546D328|nr:uncharacterized protein N7483_003853 [Penicillium malachiteum]KAJ5729345.1 hypothetical protein N7483_003853 [Penicillium malachiteum]